MKRCSRFTRQTNPQNPPEAVSQPIQIDFHTIAEPIRMRRVVGKVITRQCMNQNAQPHPLLIQPRNEFIKRLTSKNNLTAPSRMRPDQLLMNAPNLQTKPLSSPGAKIGRELQGVLVEVDMSVVALVLIDWPFRGVHLPASLT